MRWVCATLVLAGLAASGRATTYDERALIGLARASVVAEVRGEAPPPLRTKTPARAVFVTIERGGKVLGCRGGLVALAGSLEEGVVAAARSAARHDPRYRPLRPDELKDFLVTVTVVDRLEPLPDVAALGPEDGLALTSGGRTGVVLPWEGRDPAVRLKWAYRKAGVAEGSAARLRRVVAVRFRG